MIILSISTERKRREVVTKKKKRKKEGPKDKVKEFTRFPTQTNVIDK